MEGVQHLLKIDPTNLPWYTWAWVFGVGFMGWLSSSAPTLAGWIDDGNGQSRRELWTRRWGIIGRFTACEAAGLAAFFAGLLMGTPMVANCLAVLFASFAGDKYLLAQADKVSNRNPPGGGTP